ncbi:MAG: YhbY family RNA-binding protein [Bacilli bacterium]|nr:YhbY family RNA-binding protein [Bacilli bacterium]
MLSQTQKKQLKALANKLETKYQVGKKDISDTVIDMLNKALTAHELIKVDVMRGYEGEIEPLAMELSLRLKAEVVQIVGRVIVLFRRNKEKPQIKLIK